VELEAQVLIKPGGAGERGKGVVKLILWNWLEKKSTKEEESEINGINDSRLPSAKPSAFIIKIKNPEQTIWKNMANSCPGHYFIYRKDVVDGRRRQRKMFWGV